jgi:hypothetical protein
MDLPQAASSAFFRIPKFSKGDLEEVMESLRPHDVRELASDIDLPFFPFPQDAGEKQTDASSPGSPSP